jgi:hypothetical protein
MPSKLTYLRHPQIDQSAPWRSSLFGILAARIVALVECGLLEGRGNLMDIRQSEVRLPNQALADAAPHHGRSPLAHDHTRWVAAELRPGSGASRSSRNRADGRASTIPPF